MRAFAPESYEEFRGIGRRQLPTTVGGLLIHCAEHTSRHVGQAVTTAKLVTARGGAAMKIDFAGKVALVAGGTGGLGRAVSLAFLEEGAKVVVPYRSEKEFAELKRAAAGRESQLIGRVVDVLDEAAVAKLVEEIGRIDVLVNTVGGYVGGVELWKLAPADFDRMLNLNLRTGYLLARAVVPGMLKRGQGAVVNVSAKAAYGSWRWRFGLCCIEGRVAGDDGFAGGGYARHGRARELGAAEHHRHEGQPGGDAGGEVRYVAEAGGHREGDSVSRERRGEGGARRGGDGVTETASLLVQPTRWPILSRLVSR